MPCTDLIMALTNSCLCVVDQSIIACFVRSLTRYTYVRASYMIRRGERRSQCCTTSINTVPGITYEVSSTIGIVYFALVAFLELSFRFELPNRRAHHSQPTHSLSKSKHQVLCSTMVPRKKFNFTGRLSCFFCHPLYPLCIPGMSSTYLVAS